jgi:RNA polymerase sigma-70 factor (ECF subfamily)
MSAGMLLLSNPLDSKGSWMILSNLAVLAEYGSRARTVTRRSNPEQGVSTSGAIADKLASAGIPGITVVRVEGWRSQLESRLDPKQTSPRGNPVPPRDVTGWLRKLANGDIRAISRIMSAVYTDLERMAAGKLRRERPNHTLEPAALVNEFFLHIARNMEGKWENRQHFMAAASQQMRHMLVDYARARNSSKRGGDLQRADLDVDSAGFSHDPAEFLQVNRLLTKLATREPRMAKVVEMRCFGGLSHAEIAEVLEVDERTVKRDWAEAKAWLERKLAPASGRREIGS